TLEDRFSPPRAELMDGPGGHCLSGPAFTQDQHSRASFGDAFDQLEQPQHLVVTADDVAHSKPLIELGSQAAVLLEELALPESPLDGQIKLVVDHWLRDVI